MQETSRRRGSESDMALYLPDVVQQGANMVMVQLVVGLPATLDLVFLSASGRDSSDRSKQLRMAQLSGARHRTQCISASGCPADAGADDWLSLSMAHQRMLASCAWLLMHATLQVRGPERLPADTTTYC